MHAFVTRGLVSLPTDMCSAILSATVNGVLVNFRSMLSISRSCKENSSLYSHMRACVFVLSKTKP